MTPAWSRLLDVRRLAAIDMGETRLRRALVRIEFGVTALAGVSIRETEGYAKIKGSLHFPVDEPLPKELVKKLLDTRMAEAFETRGDSSVSAPSRSGSLSAPTGCERLNGRDDECARDAVMQLIQGSNRRPGKRSKVGAARHTTR